MQRDSYPTMSDRVHGRATCRHLTRAGGLPLVEVLARARVPYSTAYALECGDVHEMALVIARANQWAKGERTLIAELPDRPLPTPSWLSMHRGMAAIAAIILAWQIMLFVVWWIA